MNLGKYTSDIKFQNRNLTSFECVLFWCFARSDALLNALAQPGNSQVYGFSPVWDRKWVFRFSSREYALLQFSNWNYNKDIMKSMSRLEIVLVDLEIINIYLRVFLTVHRWGFSPVCLLICTTNIYWALKGFSSLEQSCHWQTKDFLLAPICSLFKCWNKLRRRRR